MTISDTPPVVHKPKPPAEPWLSRKQAVKYLRSIGFTCSYRTLCRVAETASKTKGPVFTRSLKRGIRYHTSDLDAWAYANSKRGVS